MDSEKAVKLSGLIRELGTAQERAAVMAQVIDQGYFEQSEDGNIMYNFHRASVQFDILQEYVKQAGEILNRVWLLTQERPEAAQPDMVV